MVHTFDMDICEFGASPSVHVFHPGQPKSYHEILSQNKVCTGTSLRVTATGLPV